MRDLIERANKYARSAGRTGEGQYGAARQDESFAQGLSWASTALSAIVGTSIVANWGQSHAPYFGLAAIVVAGLTAVQRTSKLSERAAAHREAGAEYGRLRRRADLLRLRLEAGDFPDRPAATAALEQLGDELSNLAKMTRPLPDDIYEAAKQRFDASHPEYSRSGPTHAGGVVVRRDHSGLRYLVVGARREPQKWVLPKGHIDPGESAEEAARREVLEESGVEAAVRDTLGAVEFAANGERVRAQFFLMEPIREGAPREGRERRWLTFPEAVEALRFAETLHVICQAQVRARAGQD